MTRLVLFLAGILGCVVPSFAQQREVDPVEVLLVRLEQVLNKGDRASFAALFGPPIRDVQIQAYTADLFVTGAIRTVVRERDRAPLEGAPPGDGYRLIVEIFIETAGRARITTTSLDLRRPPNGDVDSWRIVGAEGLTSVEGLYKLRVNTTKPFAARNLEVTSEDIVITLIEGTVFLVECDEGVTGLVLLGRGEMRFSPAATTERGQLRLFAGTETLVAAFDSAFIRLSPGDYQDRVQTASLTPAPSQARQARRAQEVFDREAAKSFSVDLQDLSRDNWYLLPPADDFLAEIETRRYDTLTYSRSSTQAEDISLFQRTARRTISLYPSVAKLAARGRFYTEDSLREYDVLDYNIEAALNPERQFIQGRARLAIRVRSTSLSTMLLRMAEPLTVTGITSVEYGRMLYLRLRNQNTILINLPRPLSQDSDLTLVITYSGRLVSQDLDIDTVEVAQDTPQANEGPGLQSEPHYLLSNRSFWYPQSPVGDYATATLRIIVPEGYGCVASGEPVPAGNAVSLRDILAIPDGKAFSFRAGMPLRYLAVVVSRLTRVAESTIPISDEQGASTGVSRIAVAIEANPRQRSRGRAVLKTSEDILRFYTTLVGDAPYTAATVAMLESDLPGGHSPGYFAVINNPLPNSAVSWRNDPAAFEGFPDFFVAHELAHQWWGQAVGWKNYHEQWLSEGFAQYFAALYAQKTRGDRVFGDMLRQFRRFALAESDQGPVYLGYRLGHIKSDLRVFRALVYNKGAAVLHMLRRLLGDEVFFKAIRRFYMERRYQKAGTEDFERAVEAESGRVLDRFFENWIYGQDMPRLRYSSTIGEGGVVVRFEQQGETIFDIPVTVTLTYADGRSVDSVVAVTEKRVERTIAADGVVRQVQVNRDAAALAEFDEMR